MNRPKTKPKGTVYPMTKEAEEHMKEVDGIVEQQSRANVLAIVIIGLIIVMLFSAWVNGWL